MALKHNCNVRETIFCTNCGYNLFGLNILGVCPECNQLIERSLHGYILPYANLDWLKKVARGLDLLIITLSFILAVIGIVTAIDGFFGIIRFFLMPIGVRPLYRYLILITGGAFTTAVFLITDPVRSSGFALQASIARRATRIIVIIGLLSIIVMHSMAVNTDNIFVSMIAKCIFYVISIMTLSCFLFYLTKVANIVPNIVLAQNTRHVMFVITVSVFLLLIANIADFVMLYIDAGNAIALIFVFAILPLLSLFVSLLLLIVLLTHYRRAFRRVIRDRLRDCHVAPYVSR